MNLFSLFVRVGYLFFLKTRLAINFYQKIFRFFYPYILFYFSQLNCILKIFLKLFSKNIWNVLCFYIIFAT